jgi:hypothetical protein
MKIWRRRWKPNSINPQKNTTLFFHNTSMIMNDLRRVKNV